MTTENQGVISKFAAKTWKLQVLKGNPRWYRGKSRRAAYFGTLSAELFLPAARGMIIGA
jgi:hypothetical protein